MRTVPASTLPLWAMRFTSLDATPSTFPDQATTPDSTSVDRVSAATWCTSSKSCIDSRSCTSASSRGPGNREKSMLT